MFKQFAFAVRLRAAAIHLLVSLLVVGSIGLLILLLWYPWPYSQLSGGLFLLMTIASVDLVLGPLMTLIIFDRKKPAKELFRDIGIIGVIQLAGFIYGVHAAYLARPVALVFEANLFKVVSFVEIDEQDLQKASPAFRNLPFVGTRLLATRHAKAEEKYDAVMMAMAGSDLSARPQFWIDYADAKNEILSVAKPLSALSHTSLHGQEVNRLLKKLQRPADQFICLPLLSRQQNWTIVLDKQSTAIVAYLPFLEQ